MVRLEPACDETRGCNAAFYHIGGGRGTRPNRRKDIRDADDSWIFYGTPYYANAKAQSDAARAAAGESPNTGAPSWETMDGWRKDYQQQNLARNHAVLESERAQREMMRKQAQQLRSTNTDVIRQYIPEMAAMSDDDILRTADRLEAMANSPTPLQQLDGQQPQLPPQDYLTQQSPSLPQQDEQYQQQRSLN